MKIATKVKRKKSLCYVLLSGTVKLRIPFATVCSICVTRFACNICMSLWFLANSNYAIVIILCICVYTVGVGRVYLFSYPSSDWEQNRSLRTVVLGSQAVGFYLCIPLQTSNLFSLMALAFLFYILRNTFYSKQKFSVLMACLLNGYDGLFFLNEKSSVVFFFFGGVFVFVLGGLA